MVSSDKRKREIVHAVGTSYVFYGKEKEIRLQVNPLLTELVKYTRKVQNSLELAKIGSDKQKKPILIGSVPFGGHLVRKLESIL